MSFEAGLCRYLSGRLAGYQHRNRNAKLFVCFQASVFYPHWALLVCPYTYMANWPCWCPLPFLALALIYPDG